jgi:CheY-specific phosphatase CheX
MNKDIRQSFSAAFTEVLQEIGLDTLKIEGKDPTQGEAGRPVDFICSIGLTGDLPGYLLLFFNKAQLIQLSLHLAQYFGMSQDPSDPAFVKASAAELGNQLGGRAVMLLAEKKVDCLITPPTVISGETVVGAIPQLKNRENWLFGDEKLGFSLAVLTRD